MKVRNQRHHPIRRVAISILVLLVLFGVAGTLYVLETDRSLLKSTPPAGSADSQPASQPKAIAPAANAQEGVAVQIVTTPVPAGANSSITISTNAGSTCKIIVSYGGVASTDSGLGSKVADAYGSVTWSWTVPQTEPAGIYPISVTCTYNGRSGVVDDSFQVTKS